MCNFGRDYQRYLVAVQYAVQNKRRPGLEIVAYAFLQQSLHKIRWSSGNLISGRIQLAM